MFSRRRKFQTNSGTAKPENRLLRLFRSDTGFQASPISLETADQEDAYQEAQREIRNAMLEAEHRKAEAIMTMQQRRYFS